jgi:arsenate reductase
MAEGWANHLGAGSVEAHSAGVDPFRMIPQTLEVMAEVGVDISSHRAKSAEEFVGEEFDYIITLCDNARANCPYFPGEAGRLHWPIADPYGLGLDDYRRAREEIKERIVQLLADLEDR